METQYEETNNKITLRKKLSKSEVTEQFWERVKKNYLNLIPAAYRNKSYSDLEGETKHKLIGKLKNWDLKVPLICSLLSNQNGIGKTHLAVAFIKETYYNKIKQLENINYEIYLKRYVFLENYREWQNNQEFQNAVLFDDYYSEELPPFIRNYHLNYCFIPERKLLMEYRNCLDFKNTATEEDYIKKYSEYDLLVIDDVFSSKEGNFETSRSVLLALLDERSANTMKPTILTSNLTLKEIANIDTRLSSRLHNSMLLEITSKQEDYRGRQ